MGQIRDIVFNCDTPATLADFWAGALDGYQVRALESDVNQRLSALGLEPDSATIVMLDGPGPTLCFQNIDGQTHDNNRVHLEIAADDRAAQVDRLKTLGAEIVSVMPGYTVLRDPEANQFCVIDTTGDVAHAAE